MATLSVVTAGRTFADAMAQSATEAEQAGFKNGSAVQALVRAIGAVIDVDGNALEDYELEVRIASGPGGNLLLAASCGEKLPAAEAAPPDTQSPEQIDWALRTQSLQADRTARATQAERAAKTASEVSV